MKEVILTVGPRGSGKSYSCKKAIELDPSIIYISRDELLIKLFGTTTLDSYTGSHLYGLNKMWEKVKNAIESAPDVTIILDAWTGSCGERVRIIDKLRGLGVDCVKAWYFITPIDCVDEWFWKKPKTAKVSQMRTLEDQGYVFYREDSPRKDYELFHKLASQIDSDGFDKVIRIDPRSTKLEHILSLQTSFL